MMRALTTLALLALGLSGCDEGSSSNDLPVADARVDGGTGDSGAADAAPEPEPLERSVGRMTIEQLARSIPVVTDGLRWTEDFGQGETDMLMVLAGTLGAPDYINVTEENLEPTLIIAKFMQDASQRICVRWVDRDATAERRSLAEHGGAWSSVEEADVREGLKRLQLRAYARDVAVDSPRVDALYELFVNASTTAAEGQAAHDGWLAICIATLTDPEFVLY